MQSGRFLSDTTRTMTSLDNIIEFPFKLLNLQEKGLSNIDTKKLNNNNYIDAGLKFNW